jgi:hypothetical protein
LRRARSSATALRRSARRFDHRSSVKRHRAADGRRVSTRTHAAAVIAPNRSGGRHGVVRIVLPRDGGSGA